jgi:hypothetical protein
MDSRGSYRSGTLVLVIDIATHKIIGLKAHRITDDFHLGLLQKLATYVADERLDISYMSIHALGKWLSQIF